MSVLTFKDVCEIKKYDHFCFKYNKNWIPGNGSCIQNTSMPMRNDHNLESLTMTSDYSLNLFWILWLSTCMNHDANLGQFVICWNPELYISGTWVQCCNSECQKWRYLNDVNDPSEIPSVWLCSMNTGLLNNIFLKTFRKIV